MLVITVEERRFRVFSAYSAENTLKSLSSTVMTAHYFKPRAINEIIAHYYESGYV